MKRPALISLIVLITVFAGTSAIAQPRADTLLVDRADVAKAMHGPKRGTLMTQVEAQFGAPQQKLEPRGGQQPQWPVIHRWVYPEYTVYFENTHVIDVVSRQASPGEIGPKPVD